MSILFPAGLAAIIAGGLISPLFRANARGVVYALFSAACLAVLTAAALPVLASGRTAAITVVLPFPLGTVPVALDPLSAFFVLIFAFSHFLAALYSIHYLDMYGDTPRTRLYYVGLAVLFASMLLLVVVRQAVAFLFLWEVMSLSSFALVSFEHEKEETRRAAVYYIVAMQAGFACLLAGFLVLAWASGSLEFAAFSGMLCAPGPLAVGIFLLLFVGFAVKAGFFPFHTWLPQAHPAAPAPVSAVMSGVMIKTGIYGLLRLVLHSGQPPAALSYGVLFLSLVTAVWGAIQAASHSDLKKVLASSSMENVGLIGAGIGLGMLGRSLALPAMAFLGFLGALLHILNHFLFKTVLFMGAGSVYVQTHTRNIERLGGLAKAMPVTSAIFLLGSLAASGLPLGNGFIGEFAMYLAAVRGLARPEAGQAIALAVSLALIALTGALALFGFVRAFALVFLGLPREERAWPPRETRPVMLAAQLVPAVLITAIGVFPQAVLPLLGSLLASFVGRSVEAETAAIADTFSSLSVVFLVFALCLSVLLGLRALLLRRRSVALTKTWDCGYQAVSGRLQYTAGSFAAIVRGFFPLFLGLKVKTVAKARPGLPGRLAAVEIETEDLVEKAAVKPAVKGLRTFFEFFLRVQSGNTRQYILYGVVFLVAVIVVIFGLGG